MPTPQGRAVVHFTASEWLRQEQLYHALRQKLNSGYYLGVAGYLQMFGTIDPSTNEGWGSNIWTGIRNLLNQYSHQRSLQGKCIGWFVLPEPYSRKGAQMPRQYDRRQMIDAVPASLSGEEASFPTADRTVASFAHLLENSKPWTVHWTRVLGTVPLVM